MKQLCHRVRTGPNVLTLYKEIIDKLVLTETEVGGHTHTRQSDIRTSPQYVFSCVIYSVLM